MLPNTSFKTPLRLINIQRFYLLTSLRIEIYHKCDAKGLTFRVT